MRARGKRASSFPFDRASVVVAVDASTLSLSLPSGACSGLGRLARAPIAIRGVLTGRHLSRAGREERERVAEESDAGVHSVRKTSFVRVLPLRREKRKKKKKLRSTTNLPALPLFFPLLLAQGEELFPIARDKERKKGSHRASPPLCRSFCSDRALVLLSAAHRALALIRFSAANEEKWKRNVRAEKMASPVPFFFQTVACFAFFSSPTLNPQPASILSPPQSHP